MDNSEDKQLSRRNFMKVAIASIGGDRRGVGLPAIPILWDLRSRKKAMIGSNLVPSARWNSIFPHLFKKQ